MENQIISLSHFLSSAESSREESAATAADVNTGQCEIEVISREDGPSESKSAREDEERWPRLARLNRSFRRNDEESRHTKGAVRRWRGKRIRKRKLRGEVREKG